MPHAATLPLASPLRRPRVARAAAVTLALLLALAALIICAVVGGLGSEATVVFLKALTWSSLLAIVPLAILRFLDRREPESGWLFAAAFLWGGLIATSLALPFNTALLVVVAQWLEQNSALTEMLGPEAALMIGAPLAAPIVEETTKGIGIVLLFWLMRSEFDNVRDGFIYGALVGVGFNWFESALYVQQNFAEFGTAPYGFQLGARYAWLGMAGHAMFSGLFGASLGLARATSRGWLRWLAPPVGFLLAILAHAWNNSLPLFIDIGLLEAMVSASISNLVIFLPFVLLLAWIIRRSGHWEREVIGEELRSELGRSITDQEYQGVIADRRYRTRRIAGANREAAEAIVRAQNELAIRKRRLADRGFDPESDPIVAGRRAEIAELRKRLDA